MFSVSFADDAVPSVTENDVATLVGIAVLPVPIWTPALSVRLTLSVWPSQVSATPPMVTAVTS